MTVVPSRHTGTGENAHGYPYAISPQTCTSLLGLECLILTIDDLENIIQKKKNLGSQSSPSFLKALHSSAILLHSEEAAWLNDPNTDRIKSTFLLLTALYQPWPRWNLPLLYSQLLVNWRTVPWKADQDISSQGPSDAVSITRPFSCWEILHAFIQGQLVRSRKT